MDVRVSERKVVEGVGVGVGVVGVCVCERRVDGWWCLVDDKIERGRGL